MYSTSKVQADVTEAVNVYNCTVQAKLRLGVTEAVNVYNCTVQAKFRLGSQRPR